jgi:hypothetical protein
MVEVELLRILERANAVDNLRKEYNREQSRSSVELRTASILFETSNPPKYFPLLPFSAQESFIPSDSVHIDYPYPVTTVKIVHCHPDETSRDFMVFANNQCFYKHSSTPGTSGSFSYKSQSGVEILSTSSSNQSHILFIDVQDSQHKYCKVEMTGSDMNAYLAQYVKKMNPSNGGMPSCTWVQYTYGHTDVCVAGNGQGASLVMIIAKPLLTFGTAPVSLKDKQRRITIKQVAPERTMDPVAPERQMYAQGQYYQSYRHVTQIE